MFFIISFGLLAAWSIINLYFTVRIGEQCDALLKLTKAVKNARLANDELQIKVKEARQ